MGNPSAHKIGLLTYFGKLARVLGSKNVFSASTLDQMPKQVSAGLMFGTALTIPIADIDRTDYLLILGANPFASNCRRSVDGVVKNCFRRTRSPSGAISANRFTSA